MENVFLKPPGGGEPVEVIASPEVLVPLMVQGYTQAETPSAETTEEVTERER